MARRSPAHPAAGAEGRRWRTLTIASDSVPLLQMPQRRRQPDLTFWRNLLQNANELWFLPEARRRAQEGRLSVPFKPWGAQVIFEPGLAPRVCFDDELHGVFTVTFKDPGYLPGSDIEAALCHIRTIHSVILTDAHPNAGHITTIWHDVFPFIQFDLRRNASRVEVLCARAIEFHAAAKGALRHRHFSAFAECLFAEVELLAKADLGSLDGGVLSTRSHKSVRSALNLSRHLGNAPPRFTELHNRLTGLRNRARYGEHTFRLDLDDARRMLRCARAFFRYVERRRPRRWKGSPDLSLRSAST
jgi:HEPN domain-containing protein